jgi:hypothetical protein
MGEINFVLFTFRVARCAFQNVDLQSLGSGIAINIQKARHECQKFAYCCLHAAFNNFRLGNPAYLDLTQSLVK